MTGTDDKQIVTMPRRGGLGSVELVEVHVRPGAWIAQDTPVFSVLADQGRVKISSTEAGRVLPLLAVGDKVLPGDPLYSLRPNDKTDLQPAPDPHSAPEADKRKLPPFLLRTRNWVRRWAWVVLALGVYLAAARWILPQASGFLPSLSAWSWLGLFIALVAIGYGGFHLLARRGGASGPFLGHSFAAAWAILVMGGVYLQAGGVKPLVQPLVQDVVAGSRTVAGQIATVALQAIPDVPIEVETTPQPDPEILAKEREAAQRQEHIETGRIVYRMKRAAPEEQEATEPDFALPRTANQ